MQALRQAFVKEWAKDPERAVAACLLAASGVAGVLLLLGLAAGAWRAALFGAGC